MARPLKVYGYLAWAPSSWPVETAANGGRQVRAVVAAPSKKAAADIMLTVCPGESRYSLTHDYGLTETGYDAEIAAALSKPGTVFHATADTGHTYVEAPGPEVSS